MFSRRIINWKLRVIGQMCGAHAWHEGSGDIKAPTEEKKNLCFTTGRTRKEREGEGERQRGTAGEKKRKAEHKHSDREAERAKNWKKKPAPK